MKVPGGPFKAFIPCKNGGIILYTAWDKSEGDESLAGFSHKAHIAGAAANSYIPDRDRKIFIITVYYKTKTKNKMIVEYTKRSNDKFEDALRKYINGKMQASYIQLRLLSACWKEQFSPNLFLWYEG